MATGSGTSALLPSPEISIGLHGDDSRPSLTPHVHKPSTPETPGPSEAFHSPLRHHRRTPSAHREVKETLDARTEYPGEGDDASHHHRINQYIIKEEIGRGSYGAVHLAVNQYGTEYAVKEFSKMRLRRQARSTLMRQGPRRPHGFPGGGLNGPLSHRLPGTPAASREDRSDSLCYIREEIAIMKKLNHPNLVQLIEVLDDPEEDSLWMVLEMCKKGVVMKVGVGETAKPYDEESCRCWFRDLILGIEYLHAQGVIHRDIKPDNLLLTEDDVLKVGDFGVSEMFQKPSEMMTAKSAGSPAFLPPELCVVKHGDVSGKAADIWSMGVSLYCLRYGSLPFDHYGVVEMYEAIRNDSPEIPENENPEFVHLLGRILDKDPAKRIVMAELREHPWVTKSGIDPLLPAGENCAQLVEPPNELELSRAFTRKMNHLFYVMKAIRKFRAILARYRTEGPKRRSRDLQTRTRQEEASGVDEEQAGTNEIQSLVERRRMFLSRHSKDGHSHGHGDQPGAPPELMAGKEPLFLGVGTGANDDFAANPAPPVDAVVSESPTNVDFDVYDRAYEVDVERIMARRARRPTLYLNRLVEEREPFQAISDVVEGQQQRGEGKLADSLPKNMTVGE
ncbi:calcium/calmodulin-dependent protein kinase [Sodiomyces alkalinus F11]|uniref:Calcium/calmodulin-dependent protein kinase n=1 Tax=Sodiomyces alkalinus (strain CBS 110278 / VKM F-3762 / F11) TaxID=1314773 RepID=A0A3N2PVI6_SODAK|nr:calcium/calmodulin-dependent protein kinase [Sodiomyces alkalinus F11]ROT38511.1 calcium/calmodulin-dependent protein kinase [Sodiomyces alkalinus F11]